MLQGEIMKYDTLNESQRIAQLEINYLATLKLLGRVWVYYQAEDIHNSEFDDEVDQAICEAIALMPQYKEELNGLR